MEYVVIFHTIIAELSKATGIGNHVVKNVVRFHLCVLIYAVFFRTCSLHSTLNLFMLPWLFNATGPLNQGGEIIPAVLQAPVATSAEILQHGGMEWVRLDILVEISPPKIEMTDQQCYKTRDEYDLVECWSKESLLATDDILSACSKLDYSLSLHA